MKIPNLLSFTEVIFFHFKTLQPKNTSEIMVSWSLDFQGGEVQKQEKNILGQGQEKLLKVTGLGLASGIQILSSIIFL